MTRRLLICLLAMVMVTHTTGCTSGGGSSDSEVAESNDETFAEEGEGDFAEDTTEVAEGDAATKDESSTDTTETTTDSTVADSTTEDGGDDLSLDDTAAESTATTETSESTDTATDVATSETAPPADDLSLDDASALPDEVASNGAGSSEPENITDNPAAPSDAGVFTEPSAKETVASNSAPEPEPVLDSAPSAPADTGSSFNDAAAAPAYTAPVASSPYLKIKEAAYTAGDGTTLNRVYLARPNDTAKGIATKVYGDASRSKDIVKWNPILKRGVRTGDKIYYTSAQNPSDSRMLTYYEEAGLPAQTYVAKESDNFRETAKSLLGFKDAWKEIYATNANLSEKSGRIPTGLELRYWGEAAAAPVVTTAQTETPPVDPGIPSTLPDAAPQVPPTADMAMNQGAPPADPFAQTPPDMAVNSGAPVGTDPMAAGQGTMPTDPTAQNTAAATAGTMGQNNPAPPPLPVVEQAAATPAPKPVVKRQPVQEMEEGMDADTTMALGVGGVLLLAAAVLFVVIRKNRAKRMDLGQTQV